MASYINVPAAWPDRDRIGRQTGDAAMTGMDEPGCVGHKGCSCPGAAEGAKTARRPSSRRPHLAAPARRLDQTLAR